MLTPCNQYLRPEYLTPLPTTLDAKKSPLALLAQTCSQIGADLPNSKLVQCAEKSNKGAKSEASKTKSPPSANFNDTGLKSSFKPYDSIRSREKAHSPNGSARTPLVLKTGGSSRCSSNQSVTSPGLSPAMSERKTPPTDGVDSHAEEDASPDKTSDRASPLTPSSYSSKSGITNSILTSTTDPATKDLPLGTFKPGIPPTSTYLGGYPGSGIPLPLDIMTSSLLSQHQALKNGAFGPYANYARLKPDSLMPCRDPYCTGCSLSSHLLGKSSCPAGCSQCDHVSKAVYLGHNPVAAAYAHAQLAALAAASQLPYICNWIGGDASYCGKRFSSSDELLQHLRSHTSESMLNSTSLPATHPLLHRTYPTPPLSPLATARYHPYNKPSLIPSTLNSAGLSSFPLGHPVLAQYLSPYSIYGPRLSTTSGMHP